MKKIKRLTIIFIVLILFASSYNFVYADDNVYYYAGGFPLGFDLSGEGALIVGLSEVICEDDIYLPAREAGLKSGDYIISLNGKTITTISDIDEVMKAYKGGAVVADITYSAALVNLKSYTRGYAAVSVIEYEGTTVYGAFSSVDNVRSAKQVADNMIADAASDYNVAWKPVSDPKAAVVDKYATGIVG